ncbi:MAG: NADH-quinone oxidoreductase subunit L [Nitrospiraceae bacterium]|nr:NADH-quinone oxidoreductase subunit L [Nitrospiraceae bacterium]
MSELLALIPALPFAGFLILALAGRRLPRPAVAAIGSGSVGLSALLSMFIAAAFLTSPPSGQAYTQTLGTWISAGGLDFAFSLRLDALSLLMALVITVVGFLIHLYATEYMQDDEGYSRFFSYLNLFIGAMLILVLADNLLLLYLGWEGVGLCSYLLIGFWYRDPANGRAARKAFISTRIGDTAFAVGLFLLVTNLGTLDIPVIASLASQRFPAGSPLAVAVAALLLGGALGKSAQLPLQVWLPDAMAGPTPVSALIHAATMVTAGVYLIARMHALFLLAPVVQHAVAIIGALTLLLAGAAALAQWDLKRVLAYSTISQIGYMFLALGAGAWSAAMFHFLTHAFFKALLFLGAGVIINAQHHEQDMYRMGGLRRELPLTFWTFLIGSASLSALPFVTAGFYSKDLILRDVWASPGGGVWLWLGGLVGAFLTTLYTFRMLFLVFFGERRIVVTKRPGLRMELPLVVLAVLASVGGFLELPGVLGNFRPFDLFLGSVLPTTAVFKESTSTEWLLLGATEVVQAAGIVLAFVVWLRRGPFIEMLSANVLVEKIRYLLSTGWGFDFLYEKLLINPFLWISRVNRNDVIDDLYTGISRVAYGLNSLLSRAQDGRVRWYAAGIGLGAVFLLGRAIFR